MSRRPSRLDRSTEAKAYRAWYNTARWARIRAQQLTAQPLCERCTQAGLVIEATICDHTTPHQGDEAAFYAGPFTSLCKPCHDGPKQAEERAGMTPTKRVGYRTDVRADGTPADPRHPFFAGD